MVGVFLPCRDTVGVFYSPSPSWLVNYIPEMTLTNCKCQENKDQKVLPVLKITFMYENKVQTNNNYSHQEYTVVLYQTWFTKFNERTKHTSLYKYISHFILERGTQYVVSLRDRRRNICSEKGILLAQYLLPGARGCQRLHPLSSHIIRVDLTPLIGCVSLTWFTILTELCLNPNAWFTSGYTPVRPANPMHCHLFVYSLQRDSLSKHSWSSGINSKSMSPVIK